MMDQVTINLPIGFFLGIENQLDKKALKLEKNQEMFLTFFELIFCQHCQSLDFRLHH